MATVHKTRDPAEDEEDPFLRHGRRLVEQLEEWARKVGVEPASIPARVHARLLARIAEVTTVEDVRAVLESEDIAARGQLVDAINERIVRIVREELAATAQRRPGAKRKWEQRDRQIYDLREKARLSYGQIARRLHLSRLAVQAAYRREKKRRQDFRDQWAFLSELLKPIGVQLPAHDL